MSDNLTPKTREGNEILNASELPHAPYYVTATDTFMSGWGPATRRHNVVVIPCESAEEAALVMANANGRGDMVDVGVEPNPPALLGAGAAVLYSLLTRDRAGAWFTPGRWGGES